MYIYMCVCMYIYICIILYISYLSIYLFSYLVIFIIVWCTLHDHMITWPCCELTIHHLIHTWHTICIHSAFYIICCWLRVTHQLISSIIQTQQANDQGQPQRSLLRSGNHWCRWMVWLVKGLLLARGAWKEQVVRSKGDKQVKQPQYHNKQKWNLSPSHTS
jgi:hypothetical protein